MNENLTMMNLIKIQMLKLKEKEKEKFLKKKFSKKIQDFRITRKKYQKQI
jgi:hypothetical protein